MRIAAPATCAHEVEVFSRLGADEFYCGVVEPVGTRGEGNFLNRRPTPEGNLFSFAALRELTDTAHRLEREVSFVLNETYVPEDHLPAILVSARRAAESGVDAFIVADPVVMSRLVEEGFSQRLYLSTCGNCFNAAAVEFFLGLGVSRIILPRHLTLSEIRCLCRSHHAVEMEVIVLGDPCRWDDGLCTFEHNLHLVGGESRDFYGGACSKPFEVAVEGGAPGGEAGERLRAAYADLGRLRGCGLCALPALAEPGAGGLPGGPFDVAWVAQARELRWRMWAEFVAGHAAGLARSGFGEAEVGERLRQVVGESWLLECDPPCACYFPEAAVDPARPAAVES